LIAAAIALAIMAIVFALGGDVHDVMYSGLPAAFDQ
jgi:Flp pilus assembly pilin Flp